jgi:protocatechuate 3,4-dioxygenase beta subunit
VDVWHTDAAGIYSDESIENTTGQTFLRGYQITDSNGAVTFKTIVPGWYSGRTIHIQVMIRERSLPPVPYSRSSRRNYFSKH